MVFLTKQYWGGYHNVVLISQGSQVLNKSSSRRYMKVYMFQKEEEEIERKTSQIQIQSQTLWPVTIRLTGDGKVQ